MRPNGMAADGDCPALWQWSVDHVPRFWRAGWGDEGRNHLRRHHRNHERSHRPPPHYPVSAGPILSRQHPPRHAPAVTLRRRLLGVEL